MIIGSSVDIASAARPDDQSRIIHSVTQKEGSRIFDPGPGIAADQMDKLFSPFVSTKKSRGTGLGLPVSQKILTEHGGKITVESLPGQGQGACFTLDLPAVSPA